MGQRALTHLPEAMASTDPKSVQATSLVTCSLNSPRRSSSEWVEDVLCGQLKVCHQLLLAEQVAAARLLEVPVRPSIVKGCILAINYFLYLLGGGRSNCSLDGVGCDEAPNCYRSPLANAVTATDSLLLLCEAQGLINEDNVVGRCEIESDRSHLCTQQKHSAIGLHAELLDQT